jgi:hypothetical protein
MNRIFNGLVNKQPVESDISGLAALHAGELSVVEAYDKALERVKNENLTPTLQECRTSHSLRAQALRVRLQAIGASPKDDAGFLGGVTGMIEAGAAMLGDRPAVDVLAKTENFSSEQYEIHMRNLAPESLRMATELLLPCQKSTRETMTLLSAYLRLSDQ